MNKIVQALEEQVNHLIARMDEMNQTEKRSTEEKRVFEGKINRLTARVDELEAKEKHRVSRDTTVCTATDPEKQVADRCAELIAEDAEFPLHRASSLVGEDIRVINHLIDHFHLDVNVRNRDGETPLHIAACYGRTNTVEHLVCKGANVSIKDRIGSTPLHSAATQGHTDTVELLLNSGAYVNSKDDNGSTPLHDAATEGHTETVELLLNKGAKINRKDGLGDTPLHYAEFMKRDDVVALLKSKGGTL